MTFHPFTMMVNGFISKLSGKFLNAKFALRTSSSNLTNNNFLKTFFSEYDIHEAGSIDMTGLGWLDDPEGTVSWGYNKESFQITEF